MMVGGDGVLSDARAGAGGGGGGAAMLLSLCGDEERAYAARDQNTDPCLAGGLLLIWEPLAPYSRALRASTMRKQAYARARSLAFHGWSASAVFERHTTRPQFMMCTAARKGGTMCVSILMFAASIITFSLFTIFFEIKVLPFSSSCVFRGTLLLWIFWGRRAPK